MELLKIDIVWEGISESLSFATVYFVDNNQPQQEVITFECTIDPVHEAVFCRDVQAHDGSPLFNIEDQLIKNISDQLWDHYMKSENKELIKTYKVYNITIGDIAADHYFSAEAVEDMINDKEVQERIKANVLLVEYGNFNTEAVDISLVCAAVKNLYLMHDGLYADLLILDTPFGRKLQIKDFADKVKLNILCTGEAKSDGEVVSCRLHKLCLVGDTI